MRKRSWIMLLPLIVATLACALGQAPTLVPTRTAGAAAVSLGRVSVNASPPATSASHAGPSTSGCTPRTDWPTMVIADGDTLSGIAARTGVSVTDLVTANCLTDASSIISGQTLRVPVVPSGSSSGVTSGSSANNAPTNAAPASNNCPGGNTWFFTFAFGGADGAGPGPSTT